MYIMEKRKIEWQKIGSRVVLFSLAIMSIIPFVLMISISLEKSANIIIPYPPRLVPEEFTLLNYIMVFKNIPMALYYFNSVAIGTITVFFRLFVCSLAAYAFAKGFFHGKKILFFAVLSTLIIPMETTLISMYALILRLGLYNTRWAIILPFVANAFSVFFITQYIKTIPDELLDAGRIDGCSEFRIYWQIIIPLCKPVLATLALLIFLEKWNELIWPLIMLEDPTKYTISLGIAFMQQRQLRLPYVGLMMAATTLAIVPILIIYSLLQKYIVRGIALTGLKA